MNRHMARPSATLAAAAALATVLCGCVATPTPDSTPAPGTEAMTNTSRHPLSERSLALGPASTALLQAELFHSEDARTVYVHYRLRNDGAEQALAVFDRGLYGERAGAVYAPGPVGQARIEIETDGSVTLAHIAVPPPSDDTRRQQAPLVLELAPGAELNDESITQLPEHVTPTRLRWCIGVAAFDRSAYDTPTDTPRGRIWVGGAAAVVAQQRLCTAWYDVASRRFQD